MTMTRYEYYVGVCDPQHSDDEAEFLNRRGGEGWELVSVTTTETSHTYPRRWFYFKRPALAGSPYREEG
jgi:hypothetical protein